jgi:hypothetical protein
MAKAGDNWRIAPNSAPPGPEEQKEKI